MTIHDNLRWMRRYLILLWNHTLAYRGELVIILVSSVIRPLFGLAIWLAAIESGANLPRDREFFTTYFVLLPVVETLTSSWLAPPMADEIRSGGLAKTLIVPGQHRYRWTIGKLALNAVDGLLLLPLVGIAIVLFRDAIALPTEPWRWGLFAVSMVLASGLTLTLEALIGTLAFWLEDIGAVIRGNSVLATVLGGQLVPLALMPAWSHGMLAAQPYRYTVSFPLEILTGDLTVRDLAIGFAFQAAWLGVITWGAFAPWRRGLRGYTVFNM
jgi:ABC-2 type transport system permease protein